jgi:hypothetical protein
MDPVTDRLRSSFQSGQAWEWACLFVFVGLVVWQILFPPVVGLSDNNDFAKVLGPAGVCHSPFETLNAWFVTGYDSGPKCHWSSGLVSTEIPLTRLGRWIGRPFTGRYHFDIRFSAAVHLAVLALAFGLFLNVTRRSRPLVRYLLPPFAILVFTDVAYVAYLNSAFMDNASFVLLLLLITIAAQPDTRWKPFAYAIAGILLVFSKAQHSLLGLPFAGLALYFAARSGSRKPWAFAAVSLVAASLVMPHLTPPEYRQISLFNLVFYKLAVEDPKVLDLLGLDSTYQPNIGHTAFDSPSPLANPDWTRSFLDRVSFARIAQLYLQHPSIAVKTLRFDLLDAAHSIRPDYLANYRREDGYPAHSQATHFGFWSNFRSTLLYFHPYSLLALFALPLLSRRPLAVTLALAGLLEFAVCSLTDGLDTHRHLFLFQVLTEAVILLTTALALSAIPLASSYERESTEQRA